MTIFVKEMTKLEVSGILVALQLGCSKLFSKNDVTTKYDVVQSSNSSSFHLFHYYHKKNVDVANYTTSNTSSKTEIEMI